MSFNPTVNQKTWRAWALEQLKRLNRLYPTTSIGTYPGHDPSEHDAADFMIPSYTTAAGIALGDKIAKHLATVAYCRVNGVWYVIWRGRIWSMTRPEKGWLPYFDRNSSNPSRSHKNHVHMSWYLNRAPAGWKPGGVTPVEPVPVEAEPYTEGWVPDLPWFFFLDRQEIGVTESTSVWILQKALGLKPYDGTYTQAVRDAVQAWQRDVMHDDPANCDGILGPLGAAALFGPHVDVEAESEAPSVTPTPVPTPDPEETPVTTFRVASFNILHDDPKTPLASRLARIVTAIKESKASVLLLQESDGPDSAAVQDRLGPDWIWSRAGSNTVMVDKTVWTMGEERTYSLPTPYSRTKKDCPLVQLTHRNGDVIWATSIHPSATSPYTSKGIATKAQMATERTRQGEYVVKVLEDFHWLVGGGDHNSSSLASGKPKDVLRDAGFKLLTLSKTFDSAKVDSFPNDTPGGQQIDDIWVKDKLSFVDGDIISSHGGSDHNLMVAELAIAKRS